MRIKFNEVPEGLIVVTKEFFKFQRIYLRKAGKEYVCDECQGPILPTTSPRARKYRFMAWSPRDKSVVTPSGKFTEVSRTCPECLALWSKVVGKVLDMDEVKYSCHPGKLLELAEAVYKLHEKQSDLAEYGKAVPKSNSVKEF